MYILELPSIERILVRCVSNLRCRRDVVAHKFQLDSRYVRVRVRVGVGQWHAISIQSDRNKDSQRCCDDQCKSAIDKN